MGAFVFFNFCCILLLLSGTTMKTLVTFLFLILASTAFAQSTTPRNELSKITSYLYGNTEQKALEDYIIKYQASPYRLIAMRFLADWYRELNKIDSSILFYKQALTMPDSIDDGSYRHFSAMQLTRIYMARKDYSTALNYLDLAIDPFYAKYNCGTPRMEERNRIDELYWICSFETGRYRKAIDRFATFMFFFDKGFGDMHKLYEAYSKVYTKEEIKNAFLAAEKNVVIKPDSDSILRIMTTIFDKEVRISVHEGWESLTEQEQKQKGIDKMRQCIIYQLATRD